MTLEEACKDIREWAASQEEICRVWVFGSRAKGEAKPESDIDIAVELCPPKAGLVHWLKVADSWKDELAILLPWAVDLQWSDPEGSTPYVRKSVDDQACLVFSREA